LGSAEAYDQNNIALSRRKSVDGTRAAGASMDATGAPEDRPGRADFSGRGFGFETGFDRSVSLEVVARIEQ